MGWVVTLEGVERDIAEGNTGKVARKKGCVLDSKGKGRSKVDIPR